MDFWTTRKENTEWDRPDHGIHKKHSSFLFFWKTFNFNSNSIAPDGFLCPFCSVSSQGIFYWWREIEKTHRQGFPILTDFRLLFCNLLLWAGVGSVRKIEIPVFKDVKIGAGNECVVSPLCVLFLLWELTGGLKSNLTIFLFYLFGFMLFLSNPGQRGPDLTNLRRRLFYFPPN